MAPGELATRMLNTGRRGLDSPGGRRRWAGMSADGKFGSDQCATVRGRADVE